MQVTLRPADDQTSSKAIINIKLADYKSELSASEEHHQ